MDKEKEFSNKPILDSTMVLDLIAHKIIHQHLSDNGDVQGFIDEILEEHNMTYQQIGLTVYFNKDGETVYTK